MENLNRIESVSNPRSIHGMYPYRGKISALEAAAVVRSLPVETRLLDPFCGSGTIIYEAKRHGLSCGWGTDLNPLAKWLTEAKLNCPIDLSEAVRELDNLLIQNPELETIRDTRLLFYFHEQTLREIESISHLFEDFSPYLKGCFAGAVALAARGCNGYQWTSSTVGKNLEDKVYVSFFDKFRAKINKHHFPLKSDGNHRFIVQDARSLSSSLRESSFDCVFTSPPYFDALDYTAYYAKILYLLLEIDPSEVKPNLIQRTSTYEADMRAVLDEVIHVTTDSAKLIFVVGDKKTRSGVINGGEFFSDLLHQKPSTIIERSYTSSSSQVFDQINKTSRKEQILVWDKSKW